MHMVDLLAQTEILDALCNLLRDTNNLSAVFAHLVRPLDAQNHMENVVLLLSSKMKSIGLLALLSVLPVEQAGSLSLPSELYSSSIQSKILAIAEKEPSPPLFPQYTDRTQGAWQYFNPNTTWTTGFFPATLYAMHTRQTLCPSENDQTDWVSLGRSWSTGIIPFETHNGLQHDVGFVSFPFQEELQVFVYFLILVLFPRSDEEIQELGERDSYHGCGEFRR